MWTIALSSPTVIMGASYLPVNQMKLDKLFKVLIGFLNFEHVLS